MSPSKESLFTVIALAEHNLLLIKLDLPSNTPGVRNPVRGSPDLTLAQMNAAHGARMKWMQKGTRAGFSWWGVEAAAIDYTPSFAFSCFFSGLLDRVGVRRSHWGSQNNQCAPRSNDNDCSRAKRWWELPWQNNEKWHVMLKLNVSSIF